jgi:hypothetical protein
MLVLKMQQLIRGGRWEFDRGELDLVGAFNSVRKIVTPAALSLTTRTALAASVMAISHGRRCLPPLTNRWDKKAAAV